MARPKSTKSIAADIDRSFREAIRQIEESMEGLHKSSRAYLDRVTARAKLFQQWRDERVSRGLDVRDLGIATKPKFNFVAVIAETETPVSAERRRFEQEMDEMFPSSEAPAPAVNKSKGKK